MTRAIIPMQQEWKSAIRRYLEEHAYIVLSDIARDTAVPVATLYYWLNGRTLNLKTRAYVEAIAQWVEAHDHE
jgi:predicted transcriptional regulator